MMQPDRALASFVVVELQSANRLVLLLYQTSFLDGPGFAMPFKP